jgi:hypothetical protein
MNTIEARRVEVVDGAVQMLHRQMLDALHGIERSVLEVIESGTREKQMGERAIALRIGELDRQEESVLNALRTRQPEREKENS